MEESTLLIAARWKAQYRLLTDDIISADAFRQDAILLHKDPVSEALTSQLSLEALAYQRVSQ